MLVRKSKGACAVCKQDFQVGDRMVATRFVHAHCNGAFTGIPVAPIHENTRVAALSALERAIQAAAVTFGVSDEQEKSWDRYQKLKALALRAGAPAEERAAFKQAIIDAVKLAF